MSDTAWRGPFCSDGIKQVVDLVCHHEGVSLATLRSPRRPDNIAKVRQVAYLLARRLTDASYPAIGQYLDRHHTTVLHCCHDPDPRVLERARQIAASVGIVM